ncbi:MAG: glycosyltransferase [Anaerolineae bacterium]|nr:glycosyltransferase [Anaerolineae bacterium]
MPFSVSVIIPTYNRAELVQRAINSVLDQTHLPDEIIVVDDGSTDHTPDVLAGYGAALRVIQQPNAGRAGARNTGLLAAQGDLVAFLDSDDYLLPESVACRMAAFARDPALGAVYTDVWLIDSAGERNERFSTIYPVPYPSGMILAELAQRCFIVLSSVMFRHDVTLEHAITFDTNLELAEDYDFWLRLAVHTPFLYINTPLTCFQMPDRVEFTVKNWGLPTTSYQNHPNEKQHEITVQRRVLQTPSFQALSPLEQAKIYCAHGMKNMMVGNTNEARQLLRQAIRATPSYPVGWSLLALSLLGQRAFEFAVLLRRQVVRLTSKVKG